MPQTVKIAMIGFGEAGAAFAEGWRARDGDNTVLRAFDVKTQSDATRLEMLPQTFQPPWGV